MKDPSMTIKEAIFYILEAGTQTRYESSERGVIEPVPPGLSGLFTHALGFRANDPLIAFRGASPEPVYAMTLRLATDGDLDAYAVYASGYHVDDLEWQARAFHARYAPMLLGVDPFDREYVWQRFWYAQRFLYVGRTLLDTIDRMLWDLASRHARLPIYKLLGGYREQIPAYRNIGGSTIDELVEDALKARDEGYKGVKDHSYRGVKGNIELATRLRSALGEDFLLFHDPVESYTYDEAVRVGRAMERLGYMWMEEPLQDYDLLGLQKLCATLDLPILALEWIGAIGGQPYNTAPYLALRAADIVRQRGIGITGEIKQAQLAESFGVDVHGGDPQVILGIRNDPVYESLGLRARPPEDALDCRGTLVVENGYMSIAWSDRPAQEPDWDGMARKAVRVV
jgi:L-alanine-DL-glutamate epimerase-like enolase superfamily enzyme